MAVAHSYYDYLMVYNGASGEKPRVGAFYIPKLGDTLSGIAKSAYSGTILTGVQRINRSLWNIQAAESGAFKYRRNSTSCKSPVADPRVALTTVGYKDGAWLALCPPYPVIWIPQSDGQMPEDLAPPGKEPEAPGVSLIPGFTPTPPSAGRVSSGTKRENRTGYRDLTGGPEPAPTSPYYQGQQGTSTVHVAAPSKAGFSPWLLLLLAAAGVGGYAWYRRSKKKKKG